MLLVPQLSVSEVVLQSIVVGDEEECYVLIAAGDGDRDLDAIGVIHQPPGCWWSPTWCDVDV